MQEPISKVSFLGTKQGIPVLKSNSEENEGKEAENHLVMLVLPHKTVLHLFSSGDLGVKNIYSITKPCSQLIGRLSQSAIADWHDQVQLVKDLPCALERYKTVGITSDPNRFEEYIQSRSTDWNLINSDLSIPVSQLGYYQDFFHLSKAIPRGQTAEFYIAKHEHLISFSRLFLVHRLL